MKGSVHQITSDSFLQPLLVMPVIVRKLFGSHVLYGLLNQLDHVIALEVVILLQFHVLGLDFTEDVFYRI